MKAIKTQQNRAAVLTVTIIIQNIDFANISSLKTNIKIQLTITSYINRNTLNIIRK